MAEPRKPQDHKKKVEKKTHPQARFSFEHDGETYTFAKDTTDVLTPGFIRKNRHDEGEIVFGLIESLAGEDVLEVVDNMSFKDSAALQAKFLEYVNAFIGVSLGE